MTVGTCPACGVRYATGSDTCSSCGEPLTNVARVLSAPAAPRQPRWLQQNRQRAGDLRREEQRASEARMDEFRETDRRRLESGRAAAARTAARERRTVLLAGLLFALIAALAAGAVAALVF
jgi:uncharacterized Zn finger protein (UPF0148 family)